MGDNAYSPAVYDLLSHHCTIFLLRLRGKGTIIRQAVAVVFVEFGALQNQDAFFVITGATDCEMVVDTNKVQLAPVG
jgi:hypothetical protein